MKKVITIKSLTLNNFKGIKSLHVDFENQTDIYGSNGTGKTTIADAVSWLWFGKDSSDRKDFEIKNLDTKGKSTPMVECEVSAIYDINGDTVTMRRILKENWVKKRGEMTPEFSGNVTDLYWNDVPVNLSEFNNKVNAVLNEQVFKMITSPMYFNSIDWKQRRGLLINMVGEISDEVLAAGNPSYEALIANLTQGKTMDDYKAQIKASIKKAKDDLAAIPTRVDEVNRTKPESQDFEALAIELAGYQKELDTVDGQLADANLAFETKLNEQKALKIEINNVEVEIYNIEKSSRKEAQDRLTPDTSALDKLTRLLQGKEGELSSYKGTVVTLEQKQTNIKSEIQTTVSKMDAKRSEWETENAKNLVFDDNNFCCPTCDRAYESGDVEAKKAELTTKFQTAKASKLSEITAEGQRFLSYKAALQSELNVLPERIEEYQKSIAQVEKDIENIKAEIASLNNVSSSESPSEQVVYESILALNLNYETKKAELQTLKGQLVEIPAVDNTELVAKRRALVDNIDNVKGRLNLKIQIDNCDNRIKELKEQEQILAKQIVDVEKIQFTIENFIKDKIDRFESAINEKFKMVNFKMFEEQINGGLRETCVAMVNGVPISDVNNASKINAGIDIINTLCEFYGVTAPIFIDNAESVHTLIDTESQLVRLVVSEMHKQLEVKTKELAA